ncbi:MAG: tRNA 4-thiouridine(8) synthase ThiI [Gemmatimonadales bacterium]|nr:tRNA 4-thiouridine(8) synthase ThiI [Gemmatimonadales bacterium]
MALPTPIIAAAYAEIALKGRNRSKFMRALINNIKRAVRDMPVESINHVESRILVHLSEPEAAEGIAARLREVFGLQWVSPVVAIDRAEIDPPLQEDLAAGREPGLDLLCETARTMTAADRGGAENFKVVTKRSDREFPISSLQMNITIGAAVHQDSGLPGRMTNPDFTVNILVLKKQILLFTGKQTAYGGLPSGTSGRAMVLLSGGLDSPVAAWLMMRRGLRPEFIHFYSGRNVEEADTEKIQALAANLRRYSPVPLNLWLTPAVPFEMRSIGVVPDSYDMIMFRRYMFKTGAALARRCSCHALVAGDSLGQVASQTIGNLGAISPDIEMPIFRPLIGMDKLEIVRWSKEIRAYDTSILPYRDCCSIRSPRPVLNARPADLLRYSEQMDLAGAVAEALENSVKVVVD